MTRHALEEVGQARRIELASLGIDVTLVNPGPYLTGFNDRMADSMWECFGDESRNGSEAAPFRTVTDFVPEDIRAQPGLS